MTTLPEAIRASHRALFAVALCIAPAACGGQTSTPTSTTGGTGELELVSSVPVSGSAAGASYEARVSFARGVRACATTTIGACVVDPCFAQQKTAGSESPSAGSIVVGGADMTAIALQPNSDGSYSSNAVTGLLPWKTGGEMVMFQWQNIPGDQSAAGDRITQSTPPYIALTSASAFASKTDSLSRDGDLDLAWTSDSPAHAGDVVVAELASGGAQAVCTFDAAGGNGVIPSAALASLGAGDASFEVHAKSTSAKEVVDASGATWNLSFDVETRARTSYGVASGAIKLQ